MFDREADLFMDGASARKEGALGLHECNMNMLIIGQVGSAFHSACYYLISRCFAMLADRLDYGLLEETAVHVRSSYDSQLSWLASRSVWTSPTQPHQHRRVLHSFRWRLSYPKAALNQ
jgi:hypothetical protein